MFCIYKKLYIFVRSIRHNKKINDMKTLKKLQEQYENAKNRYNTALTKKYYTYTEQQKVYAQRELWSDRMDKIEYEILSLYK